MSRLRKLSGRDLEELFLGRQGEDVGFIAYKPLKTSVLESLRDASLRDAPITTEFFAKLKWFVEKYLKSFGVEGKLSSSETTDTHADAHYGADLVFSLEDENQPFVTVDLFSINDDTALEVLAARYPEKFDVSGDIDTRRWMARIVLITNYLQFQNDLFNLKRHIREKEARNRRSNHFVLTPFDIYRGRGLRALGREIALSLRNQIHK